MFMIQCIGAFVAILFLFVHSWRRNRNAIVPNWPILGMLPSTLHNISNYYDYITLVLKHHGGTFRFEGPWFTNTSGILTSDPMNVHHIVSKNFGNYEKGSNFKETFETFGAGSLNSDSDEWKKERTMLHSFFKRKNFEIFLKRTIQKKLENFLLPFLDHASIVKSQVDLHDALTRFTFDITCTFLFGSDPNCLQNNFSHDLGDITYHKALSMIEEAVVYRGFFPAFVWKLQKWLQIGQEKKLKVAQESLDKFLHECILSKLEEQNRFSSTREVEDSDCDLIKDILKGAGKGKTSKKYLRDTAVNLLLAGNGTVSASLSWFFWLVSCHPVVEVKIIQEMKDNCLSDDENLITSIVEKLDKLVYLHGAICEALRLYPPVPIEQKFAIKADILPSGVHVSPNTRILYYLYSMGRMEKIWGEDCMEFKPERWISKSGQIIHVPSYKFIAFNAGPRSCLGKDITFFEMKMAAAAILWKFRIHLVEGHPVTPRLSITLGMKYGLKVEVTKRCI